MIHSISHIPLSLLFSISLLIQVRGQLVTRQANTPSLLFNPMGDKHACEKTYIRWAFSGEGTPMTLLLLKVGAPTSTSATPISKTLNSTLDPLTGEFEWKADVPPGRYRFNASLPALDATFQSETFDVKMVLSAKTPLSSSRSIVTSSAATSSSELLDTDATSIPSVTCPPRLSAKPRVKTSNVYVLVGVAIGANALLVETLFACFLLRKGRIAPWRLRP